MRARRGFAPVSQCGGGDVPQCSIHMGRVWTGTLTSASSVKRMENRRSTVNIGSDNAFVPESPVTIFPR